MNLNPAPLLLLFFLSLSVWLRGQETNLADDRRFADHLVSDGLHHDAVFHLQRMQRSYLLTRPAMDSLNFQLAGSFERIRRADSAAAVYARVSPGSALYPRAFYSRAALLLQHDAPALARAADDFLAVDSSSAGMKSYTRAAAFLLGNDTAGFRRLMESDRSPLLLYRESNGELKRLQEQDRRLRGIKKKSPFVAGALSAVVPGLGKVYAGKPRHGLAAFLPTAILGVQAYEAYRKGGWKDARFIGYASLFSVFYFGNIYGSALTVRVQRRETIHDVHYVVQADLAFALQRARR